MFLTETVSITHFALPSFRRSLTLSILTSTSVIQLYTENYIRNIIFFDTFDTSFVPKVAFSYQRIFSSYVGFSLKGLSYLPYLPYPTLPYLLLPFVTLPYLTLAYFTLPYLTLPDLTLPYLLYLTYLPYLPYLPYSHYLPYLPYLHYLPYSPYLPYLPYSPYLPYHRRAPHLGHTFSLIMFTCKGSSSG